MGMYVPGWPRKSAYLAYKDCSINHRRNGVYGAMFMAATISAAFVVDDPMEACENWSDRKFQKICFVFAEGMSLGA